MSIVTKRQLTKEQIQDVIYATVRTGEISTLLDELGDVNTSTALNNQILVYNSILGSWTNQNKDFIPGILNDLTNVNATEINDYYIYYNSTAGQWQSKLLNLDKSYASLIDTDVTGLLDQHYT